MGIDDFLALDRRDQPTDDPTEPRKAPAPLEADKTDHQSLRRHLEEAKARMERARDACEGTDETSPERLEALARWMDVLEAHCDMYEQCERGDLPLAAALLANTFCDDTNRWLCDHDLRDVDFERATALGPRLTEAFAPSVWIFQRLAEGFLRGD